MAHDAVTTFVQTNYTANGVSVSSRGTHNVTLELPADFVGLTELLVALRDLFGGTCDISTVTSTTLLTVWLPDERIKPSGVLAGKVAVVCMAVAFVGACVYFSIF